MIGSLQLRNMYLSVQRLGNSLVNYPWPETEQT
uniref:Uncharacterized protein n=1 Tax=Nelumbo nucifera TaxID=4432 RepID=A0A822Z2S1_NELNU|nr:TPA_asm: hypothetical protein HUJ06_008390 [Nelumbo nucifera]